MDDRAAPAGAMTGPSPSAPLPPSPSASSSAPSRLGAVLSAGSIVANTAAWLTGHIPPDQWKWPLVANVVAVLPVGVLRELMLRALDRVLPPRGKE